MSIGTLSFVSKGIQGYTRRSVTEIYVIDRGAHNEKQEHHKLVKST